MPPRDREGNVARTIDVAALEPLLDLLAEKLAERMAKIREATAPLYCDADSCPVGKRPFLEAARRGDFPSFKRGRKVLALRSDVDAWIAAGRRAPAPPVAPAPADPASVPTDELSNEAILAKAGIRLGPKRARGAK